MKNARIFVLLFALLSGLRSESQVIFPTPEKYTPGTGKYHIKREARCDLGNQETPWTVYFRKIFLPEIGCNFKATQKNKADFRFAKDSTLSTEAYSVCIDENGIEIRAGGEQGFFYALQTLRQLPEPIPSGTLWPYIRIIDRPRYAWRSFMLDSGRQYQQLSTIKKYIDMAALLKMNYFHWHLTEGLGWRPEIKKYPRLTAIGAFVGKAPQQQGFYSQEDIREIVRYAAERYVTIVPEIDMPGHSEAALTAYPELSCFGKVPQIPEQGFTPDIFCVSKPATLSFLKDILTEICDLFPSPYIHLGGDEAPKGNWNRCPDCQAKIKQEGLANSHELQIWFTAQIAGYLKQKGRQAIFWDDIMDGSNYPLPDNVIVHWWNWRARQERPFREAIQRGYRVICGTNYYTYLNFPLTPWKGYKEDRTFDIRDIYEKNPSANREDTPGVIGMSTALWTDYVLTEELLDQRLFPRILALAEQMWHRGDYLPFDTFLKNIEEKKQWLNRQGYDFGPGLKTQE